MSPSQVIELLIIVSVAALFAVAVPRVWRGTSELNFERPSRSSWTLKSALGRGMGRALPVFAVSLLLLFTGGFAADVAGEAAPSYDLWMGIGVVGLLGMLFLAVPVVWLNRPRVFVPPPQRDDPGALAEWRSVRARQQP